MTLTVAAAVDRRVHFTRGLELAIGPVAVVVRRLAANRQLSVVLPVLPRLARRVRYHFVEGMGFLVQGRDTDMTVEVRETEIQVSLRETEAQTPERELVGTTVARDVEPEVPDRQTDFDVRERP